MRLRTGDYCDDDDIDDDDDYLQCFLFVCLFVCIVYAKSGFVLRSRENVYQSSSKI